MDLFEYSFSEFLDEHPSVMIFTDKNSGKIINCNRSSLTFYGYAKSEFLELMLKDINALSPKELKDETDRAKREGRDYLVLKHKLKNGLIKDVEVRSSTLKLKDTELICSIVHDITDKIKFEKELKRNKTVLEKAQEIAHLGRWELNFKTKELYWSDEVYRIFDLEPGAIRLNYEKFLSFVHYDDMLSVDESWRRSIKSGKTYNIKHRIITATNKLKYVEQWCVHEYEDGEIVHSYGTIQDITEQMKKNRELEDFNKTLEIRVKEEMRKRLSNEIKYRHIFDLNVDAIFIFYNDKESGYSNFIEVNRAACALSGYLKRELLEMAPFDIVSEKFRLDMINSQKEFLKAGVQKEGFCEIRQKDGTFIKTEHRTKTLLIDGKLVVFVVVRDITQKLKYEDEKKQRERLLIQQSKMAEMGSMISAIAHQWKQPLNIITLVNDSLDEELEDINDENLAIISSVQKHIRDQVSYLSQTITDFRDFFKPSKEKRPFFIKNSIQKIVDILEPKLKIANIAVCIEGDESISAYGFDNEFKQVFMNIINNSRDAIEEKRIKYGKIDISFRADGNKITIFTQDNAGGIPQNLLPDKIFEPYLTTKKDGTGIGLSMSKTIIENMGGNIEVENTKSGAKFIITLPKVNQDRSESFHLIDMKILYVEDEPFTRDSLGKALRRKFKDVFLAKDGKEGEELFLKHQDIELVITDIDMPRQNGIDMAKKIKAINKDIPIIVLTSIKEDVFENVGFAAIFEKPIDSKSLYEAIVEYV